MAYLVKADFTTHLYSELIDEITRSTDAILTEAIAEAILLAKGYLSRFNRTKLFDDGATGFVDDAQLKSVVKDLTLYKLIRLANPNLLTDEIRIRYEDAIAWLKDVQKGTVDHEGWPYVDDDEDTDREEGSAISYTSNEKRGNHY